MSQIMTFYRFRKLKMKEIEQEEDDDGETAKSQQPAEEKK